MRLEIKRQYKKETYTIGTMYVDGVNFCNCLEDKDRGLTQDMPLEEIKKKKVYGETAIPRGEYEVVVSYSPKFKRSLPLIKNVKGFDGIRIHRGNTDADSLGCILVGLNTIKGKVTSSAVYETKLTQKLQMAQDKGEKITLTIE